MSELPPSPLPQTLSLGWAAVLSFFGATVVAVLGYFGTRFSATAPLQASLNTAFRSLMEEWQSERARLTARISELEGEVLRQRGVINQGLAREGALQRRIEKMERAT